MSYAGFEKSSILRRFAQSFANGNSIPSAKEASLTSDVIAASELSEEMIASWARMRATCGIETPFFAPQFTKVVGEVRPQSKVAVLSRNGCNVGFLPFEFINSTTIGPIAKGFNDAHGLICSGSDPLNYAEVIKAIGVNAYRFHALAGPGVGAEPYIMGRTRSFLADLEGHPEGYVEFLESTRATIYKQRRKTKKMSKDLGPVRLEIDCRDEATFDKLIQLKRNQYQRTHLYDLLGVPWATDMLRTLWREKQNACRGLLSVLYAGDELVAAHFGMIEGSLLHYWFPTYEPEYHAYSPGTAMFLEISKQAPGLGVKKIDLGCGEQAYKHKFVDTITEMPFGCIASSPITYYTERSRLAVNFGLKRLPGKPTLKRVLRRCWPSFGKGSYV